MAQMYAITDFKTKIFAIKDGKQIKIAIKTKKNGSVNVEIDGNVSVSIVDIEGAYNRGVSLSQIAEMCFLNDKIIETGDNKSAIVHSSGTCCRMSDGAMVGC